MSIVWRYDVINYLIQKNKYKSYLEIGLNKCECFQRIICDSKEGIDPSSNLATFRMKSDDFFEYNQQLKHPRKYDIIFIDGDHSEEQVYRDIKGSLKILNEDGIIVTHDTNPLSEWHQREKLDMDLEGKNSKAWNGRVWKAFMKYRCDRDDLFMCVVDTDEGCGLIKKGKQDKLVIDELTYKNLEKNRKTWLNLISIKEFMELF